MADKLLNMQGEIFLAERDANGNAIQPWETIGDAPAAEVSASVTELKVKESRSGFRRTMISKVTGSELTISITFRDWKPENVALWMLGIVVDVTQQTVSNEAFPAGVAAGESFKLDKRGKVSSLVITDSNGTPATLTAGTDYRSDGYGFVTFLNLGSYTQPFKAAYQSAAIKRIPIMTIAPPERAFMMRGVNTLETNADGSFKRKEVHFRRIQFNPIETMALLHEDNALGEPVVNGTILEDPFVIASNTVSPYGDWFDLDA